MGRFGRFILDRSTDNSSSGSEREARGSYIHAEVEAGDAKQAGPHIQAVVESGEKQSELSSPNQLCPATSSSSALAQDLFRSSRWLANIEVDISLPRFFLPHCAISHSSTDMRRDVQEIFRATPHHKQVMMFSATLSKEIRTTCKKFMQSVSYTSSCSLVSGC